MCGGGGGPLAPVVKVVDDVGQTIGKSYKTLVTNPSKLNAGQIATVATGGFAGPIVSDVNHPQDIKTEAIVGGSLIVGSLGVGGLEGGAVEAPVASSSAFGSGGSTFAEATSSDSIGVLSGGAYTGTPVGVGVGASAPSIDLAASTAGSSGIWSTISSIGSTVGSVIKTAAAIITPITTLLKKFGINIGGQSGSAASPVGGGTPGGGATTSNQYLGYGSLGGSGTNGSSSIIPGLPDSMNVPILALVTVVFLLILKKKGAFA